MGKICPKCGYERTEHEMAPETECPGCGIIYSKFSPKAKRLTRSAPARSSVGLLKEHSASGELLRRIVLFVFVIAVVICVKMGTNDQPSSFSHSSTVDQEAVYNSKWDGSVRQAESAVKATLKDPDSFQSISWGKVQKVPGGYMVALSYRAKNSFGGYVVDRVVVEMDSSGAPTAILPAGK